jgi:hypothetical protein
VSPVSKAPITEGATIEAMRGDPRQLGWCSSSWSISKASSFNSESRSHTINCSTDSLVLQWVDIIPVLDEKET